MKPSTLLQPNLDARPARGRHVLADVVRLVRQLAVSAVDEHDELNGPRAAEVDQRVERGANRPPGVEHIVNEQNHPVVDVEGNLGAPDERLRADGLAHQVVAIQRDVERAGGHVGIRDAIELHGNPSRQRDAALADADERQVIDAAVALDNLVGDARERSRHAVGVHHDWHGASGSAKLEVLSAKCSEWSEKCAKCGVPGAKSEHCIVHLFAASQCRN